MNTPSSTLELAEIRSAFPGRVIAPGDEGYEAARTVFYGGYDRHPALVIKVKSTTEVAQVIALARESGLELAVRSGGHSNAGHSSVEGGIVCDLSLMKDLQIDLEHHTAWAEAGLTAGEYTAAVGSHGLATGFGDTGSVGLGGITLGGGVGYLVRKHGLTIDNLLAIEVVTADGQILQVDHASHPDLFWALRGGGGNFGIVTRFQYRLHDVGQIYGGMLVLPATPEVIASFVAQAESASEDLSTIANIMTAPPMPFLPTEIHGQPILIAMLVYAGDPQAGEAAVAPFRALATPYADMLKAMTYPEIYQPEDSSYHPLAVGRTMFMDHINKPIAATIIETLKASTASMAVTQVRVLGGAYARVPVEATAYAHRNSRLMVNLAALYKDPQEKHIHEAWVSDYLATLQQRDKGAYVNFLAEVSPGQIRAAYPGPLWKKLQEIKTQYDPTNFFHINQNIPPLDA